MSGPDGDGADGGRGPAWIGAAILIAIGLVYLFRHMGVHVPDDWWAIFILIPAVASLVRAWQVYVRDGLSGEAARALLGGLVLVAITLVFLLGLHVDWGLLWPVLLILIGIGALVRAYLK